MTQTPVRTGWNVAAVTVLSIAVTGCGGVADSAGYEVILDQPEASPTIAAESTEVRPAETADAAPATSSPEEPARSEDTVEPPLETELSSNSGEPDSLTLSPDDSANEPRPTETATEVPKPVETTTPEALGTDGKPASDAASGTAATIAASPKKIANAAETKQPRIVTLLIPDKKFTTEGVEKALRVSFDDFDLLKILNMEPVTEDAPSRMPKWLKDLDGKRIRVRGFMFPPFEDENIRAFTLARDNQICCFGRNPLVYDLVDVFMRKGESTDYIQNRPFDVIGVFHIGDSIIPGELYSLDDAVVIDR